MLSLGILIALAAGAAAAWIKDRLDRRLRIDASATEILGLTVVGRMPGTRASDLSRPAMADAWRLTLANLAFANLVGRPSSIAVVSPGPEEGKSTCSLALALAAAEMGISVLIVEGDMRRPTLTEKLGVEGSPAPSGFSTALVRPMGLVEPRTLPIPGFSARLLPAGPLPPNPAALLGTERLAAFHAQAVREFDLVIYDTPPVVVGADASFLALVAEGVVVVVDETRTDRLQATRAVEQLQHARARILGVVVNRSSEAITEYYDYGRRGASNGSAPPEREFEDQISDSRA
jgi:capsular exopolysaccharide synthesis family protein